MGQLIKGKPVADAISAALTKEVEELKVKGIVPKLTIVRVGANGSDLAYERGALKRCQSIGIATEVKELPEDISQDKFIEELKKVNDDKSTHGILVFRPFPKQLSESVIKYVIAPEKDVDCFSPVNVAKVMENDQTGFAPCTPSAVIEILKHYNVPMKGKKAVVIGRSMVVGKPVSMLLLNEHATVTICHSRTENMPAVCSEADVLIVGIGKAKMIDSAYVKEGAAVIDVGINVDEQGNLCGDADTDDCVNKASVITPVPGGVGAVTTSILAKHVVKACKQQNNL
ncbi:bifunctional 5,10-methylene-tetrahydrofolate dehydrogenase/5,10-methylene-tetrahydrofolate cyclohydrolase [Clostridium sp. CX1]|uniref:Bifunctional protein FolD n=1 Tax=Clostridium tanneri TaxID=3037988 RepID=A0ABU4JPG2_9CLOT|nr:MULTISPECIES: tetrahydrofolate dehydrogenase/cyclohydrolase catalytic domain-containing protein [unclassified Clostridium]MCT8976362.1 bifunctional 5,10-methylene-tetrahydrofolate dehydrogenase/5,10-methylene-tetrahydrofolate cyclohydrolase [Clostridium sp. CX1]MDW8800026.1 tetrahydrofolate dehydrogenase/cyclohydrolase catalytic domain-containing protein [Clostridium sp. A1-XYC3]